MDKKKILNKEYYENFALNALKLYDPDKFSGMEKHESPDWICDNIGLEVTRAISQEDGNLDAFLKIHIGNETLFL